MFLPWLAICYLSGAIPWSVWLGRLLFDTDPSLQPDQNPGAANAFRAAGWRLGIAVLALDFLKGFIPVALAFWIVGFPATQMFWLALMPTLGHGFSVFLRMRGGRGIDVMFGVWAGLTLYLLPTIMGLAAVGALFIFKKDEYRTFAIPVVLLAALFVLHAPPWQVLLALAELLVLSLKIGAFVVRQRSRQRAQKRPGTP